MTIETTDPAGQPGELEPWDQLNLQALMTLQPIGESRFRSRCQSVNAHGTIFGGQLLGQALMAASMTAPVDRDATALQFLFLQSAVPDRPIDFEVTRLQDGKRFASRHVRGTQAGGRIVLDAQVTFATAIEGPEHAIASRAADVDPETLPRIEDLPAQAKEAVTRTLGYPVDSVTIDLRLPNLEDGLYLSSPTAELSFWLRPRGPVPEGGALHASALCYLSDWWLNFTSVGTHVLQLMRDDAAVHVASLNHAIWFHQPVRADGWLHFDVQSPSADRGRGLSIAKVHDVKGLLVATVAQENLLAARG